MTNLEQANKLYKDKKYQECISLFENELDKSTKVIVDIYAKLAISYRMINDYNKSEEIINNGFEKFPDNNLLIIELAALRNRQKRWEESAKLWKNIKQNSNNFSELNYERYLLSLENRKDIENIKSILKEALSIFPKNKIFIELKNKNSFKVAVQFYGHSRSFKSTFASFKKYVIDVNKKDFIDVDVFIHTWDEKEHTTIKPQYKKDYGYAGKMLSKSDIDFIYDNYKPKELLVEQQLTITEANKQKIENNGYNPDNYKITNNISYTMYKSNELRKQADIRYDLVMMTRLDIVFFKPLSFLDFMDKRVKAFMDFNSKDDLDNAIFYPYMETPNLYRNQDKYITGIDLLMVAKPSVINKITSWHVDIFDNRPLGTENALTDMIQKNSIKRHLLYYSKPASWTILRTNDVSIVNNRDKVELLQNNWNFSALESFYSDSLKSDNKKLFEYIIFLADIGKLDKIYELIIKYSFEYIESLISSATYKSDKKSNVSFMLKFYKNEFIPSITGDIIASTESKMMKFTYKNTDESLEYIKSFINQNKNIFKIDGKIQMLLNFTVNKLIERDMLDLEFSKSIVEFYCEDNKINKTRKRYMILSLINYFETKDTNFFTYMDKNSGLIQKIASTIHRFGDSSDGAKYYQKKLHQLVKLNSIKTIPTNKSPKVAVCISGMIRGDVKNVFNLLKKNIINPLNADVFIHTWDEYHKWMGIGGDINWVYRLFGGKVLNNCPNELKLKPFIQKNFPNIYNKLESPTVDTMNKSILQNLISYEDMTIENQDDFVTNLPFPKEKLMTRGHYNQAKMFYGIHKTMELMENYENTHNIKYDYVIRCRPDIGLNNKLSIESISKLEENQVLVDFFPYGPQDQFRAGKRDTMYKLASLWKKMIEKEKLSPYGEYRDIDAHNLIYLYMIENNMITIPTNVKRDVSLAARGAKVPDIRSELAEDLLNIKNEYKNRDDFKEFFKFLLEKK